jgi:UMF1 family MFS transporter
MDAPAPTRAMIAWSLYDWANSAFPTVVTTFVFATYFTQAVAVSPELGTAQWSRAQSLAALGVAILSPVLGAIADRGGRRKPWLFAFTCLCIGATALLWFVLPGTGYAMRALVLVALATLGFELACVFYNAMLPDLAAKNAIGRWSGWGWGLGYAGGLCCLVLCLVGFIQTDAPWFGVGKAAAADVRATSLVVAVWFAVFSLPLFVLVREAPARAAPIASAVREGLGALLRTVRDVRRHGAIARFLLAQMIYADGLVTLFAFGGIYAAGTFKMSLAEVIQFGILLNVTAGLGAACFARIDDRVGAKPTIVFALIGLLVCGAAVLLVESKTLFWIFGSLLGVFVGPAQAASRSMMARLAPPDMRAEMFGLFALSGKATAFLGPAVLGSATLYFNSQRAGMATILLFWLVGLALLIGVRDVRAPQ